MFYVLSENFLKILRITLKYDTEVKKKKNKVKKQHMTVWMCMCDEWMCVYMWVPIYVCVMYGCGGVHIHECTHSYI